MTECTHPPTRNYFWDIDEPMQDAGGYSVIDKKGRVLYRRVLVAACCDCGATIGEKTLKTYPIDIPA